LLVYIPARRQHAGQVILGLVMDGRDTRNILLGFIITCAGGGVGHDGRVRCAGTGRPILGVIDGPLIIWIGIGAVGRVVFAGDGIAYRLARHVLDQQPARKQQRKINNGEQHRQQDRSRQGKFNHALRTAGALPEAFRIY
jgi:hypothetical protein